MVGKKADESRTCNRMVFLQGWVCSQGSRDGKGYGREGWRWDRGENELEKTMAETRRDVLEKG